MCHERNQRRTMRVHSSLTAERAVLAVLVVGFTTFILVHSAALLQAGGEQTLWLIQKLWFSGLVVTLILLILTYVIEL